MAPRLSILLPTHNRAETLEWALRSLAAQDEGDFEVLICGDGCTDGTAALAGDWARRDGRFRWFDLPKAPSFGYANRNTVLREARGELVGFMAHDDLVFRDYFFAMQQPFADPSVHLVASRPLWVDAAGAIIPLANNLECSLAVEFLEAGHHFLPATCYMHRRAALAEVGFWNENLTIAGDLELWQRIVRHYGPGSVRYLTRPGALHFRADWKQTNHRDPHHLAGWKTLLETPGAFPETLRPAVTRGSLPQACIGELLLGENGAGWEKSVRAAADLALDSYAFEMNLLLKRAGQERGALWEKFRDLRERHAESKTRAADLRQRTVELRQQLTTAKTKRDEQQARAEKWKKLYQNLRARTAHLSNSTKT